MGTIYFSAKRKALALVFAAIAVLSVVSAFLYYGHSIVSGAPRQKSHVVSPIGIQSAIPKENVLATYTGGKVTGGDIDEEYAILNLAYGQQLPMTLSYERELITKYVVLWRLLPSLARQRGYTVSSVTLSSVVHLFEQQAITHTYKTQHALNTAMARMGVSHGLLAKFLEDSIYVNDLEGSYKASVSSSNVLAYYRSHPRTFTLVTLNQIAVNSSRKANLVLQQLRHGGNFSALAKRFSIDVNTRDIAGLYTGVRVSNLVAPIAKACMTLDIGHVGPVIPYNNSYYILRVDTRDRLPFTSVETQIRQMLMQSRRQMDIQNVIEKTITNAKIHYLA